MNFKRFVDDGLSQFSYVVADENTQEAVVIDPLRDADRYVEWIHEHDFELTAILETHIHADYTSGALELADITGVPYYASSYDTDEKYEMQFEHEELETGDTVELGPFTFEAIHTPGHTPEHISFLMKEDGEPRKLFSGDFIFVNSLGRPDLIGEEQKMALAGQLFESIQTIKSKDWPEDLQIHPAHGSGSLCGAGLSEKPETTLGEEYDKNPYFQIDDEDEFVGRIFDALGDFPPYYKRMKQTNSRGAPFVQPVGPPPGVDIDDFVDVYESSNPVTVIDLRDQVSFGESHIPGSLNLPLAERINRYAPWVVPYDQPIYLVGDGSIDEQDMEAVYRYLLRVELDNVRGYLEDGYQRWQEDGHPTDEIAQYDAPYLRDQLPAKDLVVIDVRTRDEYVAGHLPDARWIPFGRLREQKDQLPENWDQPIVTICSSGYRSSLSASLLQSMGYNNLGHLTGGFPNWVDEGYDVLRGEESDESEAVNLND